MKELDPGYTGDRHTITSQINALPGQTQAQLSGLQAQAQQSHNDILDAARRRRLGFSGIPIGEQVKYDATTFKPAVANLYSQENTQKASLEGALNSLFRDQRQTAMGIRQQELDRDQQQAQFEQQLAAQRQAAAAQAAAMSSYLPPAEVSAPAPSAALSRPQGFRDYLSQLRDNGDKNAKIALPFVGQDGRYYFDPTKKNTGFSQQVLNALNAVGAKNAYNGPGIQAPKRNSAHGLGLVSILPSLRSFF